MVKEFISKKKRKWSRNEDFFFIKLIIFYECRFKDVLFEISLNRRESEREGVRWKFFSIEINKM